jgi:Zn-dependent M28 family amino/carboxypeptidase
MAHPELSLHNHLRWTFAAALLVAGPALHAQTATLTQAPGGLAQPDVPLMRTVVQTLASDAFEGRGPGTRAEPKTLDAIVTWFKAAGLRPGAQGGWLQDVPTVTISGHDRSPLTIAAKDGSSLSFAYGTDFVAGSYREVAHTALNAAPLVFVGFGIRAPELGWDDYAGIDMHGKIAVILVNDPDYATEGEQGPFKGRRMTYYGRWTYKFEEAARQGAAGALIIHDTFPAAYGWNVVQSSWSGPTHFVASADHGMSQTAVNGWVQHGVAASIFAAAGQDLATLEQAARHKGFHAVPLAASASVAFDNTIERGLSHNVVGILPGTTRPGEVVLYSAHWDHLGHCTPDARGDGICNGAVDNATGVAALVALAEANSRAGAARRSQVFLALTLEESGLLGSEYYAAHPLYPLSHTVGGVNMDALPSYGAAHDYAMTGGDKSDLTGLFRTALAQEGLREGQEDHVERGHYYRSDHFSFAKRGVPMFALSRGHDLLVGGTAAGDAASEDYVAHRYHQPSDEYSDTWDWSGIAEDVRLYYRLGRTLADSDQWPNWHKDDEFRASRDASVARGD